MTFEDYYTIPTAEGVSLHVVLAGLGSRFMAFAIDFAIQVALAIVVLIGISVSGIAQTSKTSQLVVGGIYSVFIFLDFFGYFVFCEMLFGGRTPGKFATGIRAVKMQGGGIGFWSSLLRNLLRIVDMLPPPFYLVGSAVILSTPRNQRLGDLVANTIVVRDRLGAQAVDKGRAWQDGSQWSNLAQPTFQNVVPGALGPAELPREFAYWDISAISDQYFGLIRTFLANRSGYSPEMRSVHANQLANHLWPLVSGPIYVTTPEEFLEAILFVKQFRS